MKYSFEIGLHFKINATKKQKECLYKDLKKNALNFAELCYTNKHIRKILLYTNQIEKIEIILNNSKILRYFYIENLSTIPQKEEQTNG